MRSFPLHKPRPQRKLVRSQPHRFLRVRHTHAFHLEQDLPRTHHRHPMIRSTLALAHTGFSRLLRNRLVRKKTDPYFPATLDETRDRHAARLNLAVADPARLQHLQPVLTEGQLGTAPRLSSHASALLLAVLNFFWHQHKNWSSVVDPQSSPKRRPRELLP